jgi:hypothetical protein
MTSRPLPDSRMSDRTGQLRNAQLSAADRQTELRATDLERLATAAGLLGQDAKSADFLARAYHDHLGAGAVERAARCAFWLAFWLAFRGELAKSSGWLTRAERLLTEQPDCAEQGLLLLPAAGVQRLPRTVGVRSGTPVVEDHRIVDAASVIWATGYRSNFGWIDLPVFGSDGQPLHDRGVVGSEPGLYFVGLPFLFTLTWSLVGGVGRDAEHIAEHIAGHPDARAASRRVSRAAADPTPPRPLPGLPRS